MLSRKPVLLYSSYYSLCSLNYSSSPAGCTTSRRPVLSHGHCLHARTYAQHAAAEDAGDESDLSWPAAVHPHSSPTPYQILRCKRGQAYTKHRFYFLVKLYHPDSSDASSPVAHLPPAVRLERYRLLVAAHTILADDTKRKAYDAWGLGWSGHHQPPTHSSPEQRQWTHDPSGNATWEDWERWYQRESGADTGPQGIQISNFAFVSSIFGIVVLGGIMQGTGASMFGSSMMEQREKIHKEASLELARSRRATMSDDRNERIRTFLEHRDATLAGENAYQRYFQSEDSDSVRNTDRDASTLKRT